PARQPIGAVEPEPYDIGAPDDGSLLERQSDLQRGKTSANSSIDFARLRDRDGIVIQRHPVALVDFDAHHAGVTQTMDFDPKEPNLARQGSWDFNSNARRRAVLAYNFARESYRRAGLCGSCGYGRKNNDCENHGK